MTGPLLERAYGRLCRHLVLPLADRMTGQDVMARYEFYDRAQWWDAGRLRTLQNQRLAATVTAAYEGTAFYRELYDGSGVRPGDIRTIDDLPRLPIVTKSLLRAAYPDRCTRRNGRRWQEWRTSGSTGRPLAVRLDAGSLADARALMLLRATYAGWQIGQSLLQTGFTPERGPVKRCKDLLLRVSYVPASDLSDRTLDRYLEIIEHRRHRYVMGYASSLYLIAARAEQVGFNRRLDGLVSWGDNLFPHYRDRIERQFGCRVTDTYGCGEGIQVAAQCGAGHGAYHIFTPHVAVEFVEDGQPVAPGESGSILLTRLDPGVMPLVRYEIGDVGRRAASDGCACGRGFALMQSIEGRASDIVTTPNGNRLIVHFFTALFEHANSIDTFQVVQERRDAITVRVVSRAGLDRREWQALERQIHELGDPDLRIDLDIVDTIPIESGNKRRFVVSRVAPRAASGEGPRSAPGLRG